MPYTTNRSLKLTDSDIERLRDLWDAGIASGTAGEVDFPALRAEARKRLQELKDDNGTRPASS